MKDPGLAVGASDEPLPAPMEVWFVNDSPIPNPTESELSPSSLLPPHNTKFTGANLSGFQTSLPKELSAKTTSED